MKYVLLVLAALCLNQNSAFAFDAPSGSYDGGKFTFQNKGNMLTLIDRSMNATYQLRLDSPNLVQFLAPEFTNADLYTRPEVHQQRQILKSVNITGVAQMNANTVRATVNSELGFKTVAGYVTVSLESPVVVRYGLCNTYWWPPSKRQCIAVDILGARLTAFQSPLGDTVNKAVGMLADIAFQVATLTHRLPSFNIHHAIAKD